MSASIIDNLLAAVDREWRGLGVGRRDRVALAADLRGELESAAGDGLDPAELLGDDPAGFARRIAEEAGVERVAPRYGQVLGAATAGGVLALVAGFALVNLLHEVFVAAFDLPRGVHVPIWLAAGVFYGGVAAVVIVGAVLAVRFGLRDVPRSRRTAARMAVLLPPALVVATGAAAGFGLALDFPLTPVAIGTEAAIVLAAFLTATGLARRWSVSRPTGPDPALVNESAGRA